MPGKHHNKLIANIVPLLLRPENVASVSNKCVVLCPSSAGAAGDQKQEPALRHGPRRWLHTKPGRKEKPQMGSCEEMKSRQKLRIKTGSATDKTFGAYSQPIDKQHDVVIRNHVKCPPEILESTNKSLRQAVGWAFLIPPQKEAKKSQENEKTPSRTFAQLLVLQSDTSSCTTQKIIQATRKACLPSVQGALLLLQSEKEPRRTAQVSLFDLCPSPQTPGHESLAFTTASVKSATVSKRNAVPQPWPIFVLFALSAAKSPCLRVSLSPRLPP